MSPTETYPPNIKPMFILITSEELGGAAPNPLKQISSLEFKNIESKQVMKDIGSEH